MFQLQLRKTAWPLMSQILISRCRSRLLSSDTAKADGEDENPNLDIDFLEKVSQKRSRKERVDSVTDKILAERTKHMTRIVNFEANPTLVIEIQGLKLGKRKQPLDSRLFAKKFLNNKRVETGVGAGGFAIHLGSASKDWPIFKHNLPEIALAGHTNCGKSTLVNALAGIHPRQGPAGVSDRAGWTDFISFYQIGKKPPVLTLVDLPGYGHAVANRAMQREWKRMIKDYLSVQRKQLCRCCVLVDSTRGLAEEDFILIDYLEKIMVEYQIVMTMGDLLSPVELAQSIEAVTEDLGMRERKFLANPKIVPVSGHTGAGVTSLWNELKSRSLLERGSLVSSQEALRKKREVKPRRKLKLL